MKDLKMSERLIKNPSLQKEFKAELNQSKSYFTRIILDRKVETRFLYKQKCFCLTETSDDSIVVYSVTSFKEEVARRFLKFLIPLSWE